MKKEINCEFCKKELDITQEVIRTKYTKVIYPRRPAVEPYVMIMPIRHCENVHDLNPEEFLDIFDVVKKFQIIFTKLFGTEGYNLFVNNGVAAGQHIQHVHFHLIGRSVNETVSPFEVLNNTKLFRGLEKLTPGEINKRALKLRNEFKII